VIGQAKGIIMTSRRVASDAAFDLLRRASQRTNLKLHDLAQQIAATGDTSGI
jgi:AmiR/NasT family two-component response regulator